MCSRRAQGYAGKTQQCPLCLQAVEDFRKRIQNYEDVYEPISDRSLHYIKLIDM